MLRSWGDPKIISLQFRRSAFASTDTTGDPFCDPINQERVEESTCKLGRRLGLSKEANSVAVRKGDFLICPVDEGRKLCSLIFKPVRNRYCRLVVSSPNCNISIPESY